MISIEMTYSKAIPSNGFFNILESLHSLTFLAKYDQGYVLCEIMCNIYLYSIRTIKSVTNNDLIIIGFGRYDLI
jgi:hypothetical protein